MSDESASGSDPDLDPDVELEDAEEEEEEEAEVAVEEHGRDDGKTCWMVSASRERQRLLPFPPLKFLLRQLGVCS